MTITCEFCRYTIVAPPTSQKVMRELDGTPETIIEEWACPHCGATYRTVKRILSRPTKAGHARNRVPVA